MVLSLKNKQVKWEVGGIFFFFCITPAKTSYFKKTVKYSDTKIIVTAYIFKKNKIICIGELQKENI